MEIRRIESIIEAVLFASGDAVSAEKLSEITQTDINTLRSVVTGLADRYTYEKRGIKIIKVGDKYQMATRGEFSEYVRQIVEPRRRNPLSKATLEVLAIIAYKQPVTRVMIEKIRGVNCDNSVTRLLELGLIEETGKLDAPGRPSLFCTTDEFLRSFAIDSISELPPITEFIIEEPVQAMEEAVE
ncbi:MAG: Segregation and condensation protein B [Firmicutes bacterium ADurb.Bin193]|nr:MAG: Segregation and condensation protein B [Firmicutes bacterium ADurb.Bin193]